MTITNLPLPGLYNQSEMRLVICVINPSPIWNWPEWATEKLRAEFPAVEVVDVREARNLDDLLPDTDALVTSVRLRPQQIASAKRLRWIHSPSAAVHHLLSPELAAAPITLTNGAVVHGSVVAEHAMALLLGLARGLRRAASAQDERRWSQRELWSSFGGLGELRGRTILIVGLGHIGRELAPRLRPFGVHLAGIRNHPELGPAGCDEVFPPAALAEQVSRADAVVLALPVTDSTRGLIGAAELERFKAGAWLVNVGRGDLVDELALIAALQSGHLGAAALDVFEHEPLAAESPLWTMPQVLITPHIGSTTGPSWKRQAELVGRNLHHLLAGEPLEEVVDKTRGY
jgi:phosphoglycerate dehydrogenase-like enzyme